MSQTDFEAISIFVKVVESGSFSAAARLQGIPKSKVSRKIAQLEDHLGVRLLQRTTRKLTLTEIGQSYHEHCRRILFELEEAEHAVQRTKRTPRGTLRLSAPMEFGQYFLGPLLFAFMDRYPELVIEVDLSRRVVDLVEEGYDMAIRIGHLTESSLVARKMGAFSPKIFASPGYLAQHGRPQTLEDLLHHNCLLAHGANQRPWRFLEGSGIRHLKVNGNFRITSITLQRDAALHGLGIARLPSFVCAEAITAGSLIQILEQVQTPSTPVYAVYPSRRNLIPKVKLFINFLAEAFAANPLFDG